MNLDKKIISEIERYNRINKYITEQAEDALVPPPTGAGEGAPPPPAIAGIGAPTTPPDTTTPAPAETPSTPEKIDVENDPDVEKLDDKGDSKEKDESTDTEELDVTELVDSQKTIQTKQDEYFENLFSQLSNLESRLGEMDQIMSKLNSLESKIEKYREKTPQEKLELRTYDSYPFNQKLTDFFDDKQEEMEKTGKHEYVLTDDQVSDINVNDIKNSFQPSGQDREDFKFK